MKVLIQNYCGLKLWGHVQYNLFSQEGLGQKKQVINYFKSCEDFCGRGQTGRNLET